MCRRAWERRELFFPAQRPSKRRARESDPPARLPASRRKRRGFLRRWPRRCFASRLFGKSVARAPVGKRGARPTPSVRTRGVGREGSPREAGCWGLWLLGGKGLPCRHPPQGERKGKLVPRLLLSARGQQGGGCQRVSGRNLPVHYLRAPCSQRGTGHGTSLMLCPPR